MSSQLVIEMCVWWHCITDLLYEWQTLPNSRHQDRFKQMCMVIQWVFTAKVFNFSFDAQLTHSMISLINVALKSYFTDNLSYMFSVKLKSQIAALSLKCQHVNSEGPWIPGLEFKFYPPSSRSSPVTHSSNAATRGKNLQRWNVIKH